MDFIFNVFLNIANLPLIEYVGGGFVFASIFSLIFGFFR